MLYVACHHKVLYIKTSLGNHFSCKPLDDAPKLLIIPQSNEEEKNNCSMHVSLTPSMNDIKSKLNHSHHINNK